nr:flagellar biosynthetic protein FliR [Thioalkalivibrio sp. ALgr3]
MEFSTDQMLVWVAAVMWPLARIGAMLVVMPIFGGDQLNARMRMGLALVLAVVVAMQEPALPEVDPISLEGAIVTLHQVLIGLTMGFILQLVFSALTQAGEVVALSMGLGFASVMDPAQGIQVPVISTVFVTMATLIFLALNGHLILFELLLASFETMPVAPSGLDAEAFMQVALFGQTMFAGAVLVALPAVASLLVVNISMGVITRASPQLNIFAVGFPMMILMGFVLLLLILPGLPERVGELAMEGFGLMQVLLGF